VVQVQQRYRETFNDGWLQYGTKQTQRSEMRKKIGEAFVAQGHLAFKEMSARESDYQLAGTLGAKLDRKVKTLFPPSFRAVNKSKIKVVIGDTEYDVLKVDEDNSNQFLYFYLQEVV